MIPEKIMEILSDEWVVNTKEPDTISNGPRILRVYKNTVTPSIYNGDEGETDGIMDDDHDKAFTVCVNVLDDLYSGDSSLIVVPKILTPAEFDEYPGTEAILFDLQTTNPIFIKRHPGPKGTEVVYIEGSYVTIALNYAFKFKWSFEHIATEYKGDEVIVYGELTVKFDDGDTVMKSQAGCTKIKYRKQSEEDIAAELPPEPLSIGNDVKAAITDCKKKCASELGIGFDVYSGEVK